MTEEAGAAEAAAEPIVVPEIQSESTSNPAPEPTARGAIDRAFAAVDEPETVAPPSGEQTPEKPVAPVAEPGQGQPRGEDGKFVAKTADEPLKESAVDAEKTADEGQKPEPATNAPERFSADAKAVWKDAPAPIKAEVSRAISELESGIAEYRQKMEPLKPFEEMAAQNGTDIQTALRSYTQIDALLNQDIVQGLSKVAETMGYSLYDVAAHVMNQTPEQAQSQNDATIRALRSEIDELRGQVGNVSTNQQTSNEAFISKQVNEFKAQNSRFDELEGDMAFFINSGRTKDLQEAYNLAERLNPAPSPAPAPAVTPAPPANSAQTQKGSLSVTGAPSPGSNPGTRKVPSSPKDAVDNAFATLGIG